MNNQKLITKLTEVIGSMQRSNPVQQLSLVVVDNVVVITQPMPLHQYRNPRVEALKALYNGHYLVL